MDSGKRLSRDFYISDVLEVAPELPGKNLVVRLTMDLLADSGLLRLKLTGELKIKPVMLLKEELPELK